MRTTPDADDLDLPPLDGEGDEDDGLRGQRGVEEEELDEPGDDGDALDDSTAEGDPIEEIAVDGAEGGWLAGADDVGAIDVGTFDLGLSDEGRILEDDEPDGRPLDDLIAATEDDVVADGGEEGPLAEDEELREEDLPALDADEDGDVDEDGLYDHAALGVEADDAGGDLRWDDRAWARVEQLPEAARDDADDSGMLVAPGEDQKHGERDATWRRLEESGRITAATLMPGESVIVALDGTDRPVLVRIVADGAARIIAEIDVPASDDGPACRVTGLRWDVALGCIVATGTFGTQAFRPA